MAPSTTIEPSAAEGQRSRRIVRLIVGLLCVVGLLVATLTWRYFWFTDPRRGLSRSRAMLAQDTVTPDDADSGVIRVWQDGEVVEPAVPAMADPVQPSRPARAPRPAGRRRPPAHRRTRRS